MGVEAFSERARRELLATGEIVRKRTAETSTSLTAQEAEIAGLVVDGLTNAEIGAMLYLSPRTVEWHLRKVFMKLGISSRRQLRTVERTVERGAVTVRPTAGPNRGSGTGRRRPRRRAAPACPGPSPGGSRSWPPAGCARGRG